MKTTKYLLALLAGLFVTTNSLQAAGGVVTVTAGNASPNPLCVGDLVSSTVSATATDPSDPNCELKVLSRSWEWSADSGDCSPPFPYADDTVEWFGTPPTCGNQTVTITATVTFECTDCHGNSVTKTATGSATISLTVVGVNSLVPYLSIGQGDLEPGSDPETYWICPCEGDVIVTASSCPNLPANQLPACWSFTGGAEIDKLHRKVSKVDLVSAGTDGVPFTVTCGTSTKTIILRTDPPKPGHYEAESGSNAGCKCDNYSDSTPTEDLCGNRLTVDCVDCDCFLGAGRAGHFSFRYNGSSVGVCRYSAGMNDFLFKRTKHNCRILRTWHCTMLGDGHGGPAAPCSWTITKYDAVTGVKSINCYTAPVVDITIWLVAPADETSSSIEGHGTPVTVGCPIHPTWN